MTRIPFAVMCVLQLNVNEIVGIDWSCPISHTDRNRIESMRIGIRSQKSPLQELTVEQRRWIDAQCTRLVYDRSLMGIAGTLISALVIAVLLWQLIPPRVIAAWLTTMLLLVAGRIHLVVQFGQRERDPAETNTWRRWHTAALGLTGVLWAMTMIFLFPEASVPHQFGLTVILSSLVAGSGVLYSLVNGTFVSFSVPIILASILRLAMYPDMPHLTIAGLALLLWMTTAVTGRSIRHARYELLLTNHNLMDRVTAGMREVEHTNRQLQAEILERRHIEESLRQERDRLETITRTIGAGLAVISKDYRVVWANRVFADMFGQPEDRPCFHVQFRNDSICQDCGARMIFEMGYQKISHEQKGLDANGKTIWYQIVTTPITDSSGRVTAALELVLPITERKLAQQRQKQMTTQLEQARKAEAIATLAGGIAHQFNNALAVIVGNTELLEDDIGTQVDIGSYVRPIFSASKRMAHLTEQLLAYAHGGKYRPHLADMVDVVQTTMALLKHTLPDGVTIQTHWGDPPKVTIDVTQMQMVISAVVSNALEAMEHRGCVTIRCDGTEISEADRDDFGSIEPGRYADIIVTDDGVGMDGETLARVFEPFFTTKFQGRGLGMAAVYGIIKNHGGHISVASRPQKGTRVRIVLPGATEPKSSETGNTQSAGANGRTILLVEDEQDVLTINQVQLERSGYRVIPATTGQSAIDIIHNSHQVIDILLLDLKLPDMDGRAVLPHVRKHVPDAKVLICSGYSADGPTGRLMDAGVSGFIQKPFTLSALLEKLQQISDENLPGV